MQINFAHLRERAQSGAFVDFAVFDARSSTGHREDNSKLLSQLTSAARRQGLKIDQAALVFRNGSRSQFFGDKPLVSHLTRMGVPRWTHTLTV